MAIPVTCGGCSFSTDVPDRFAGRRGRCKRCGGPIAVPVVDGGEDVTDPGEPILLVQVHEEDELVPGGPAVRAPAPSLTAGLVPPMASEPLYYRFLYGYGCVQFYGGLATWVIWSTKTILELRRELSGRDLLDALPFALLWPGLFLVGSLFFGGMVLMAVDSARTLRVIRLQGHVRA